MPKGPRNLIVNFRSESLTQYGGAYLLPRFLTRIGLKHAIVRGGRNRGQRTIPLRTVDRGLAWEGRLCAGLIDRRAISRFGNGFFFSARG